MSITVDYTERKIYQLDEQYRRNEINLPKEIQEEIIKIISDDLFEYAILSLQAQYTETPPGMNELLKEIHQQ